MLEMSLTNSAVSMTQGGFANMDNETSPGIEGGAGKGQSSPVSPRFSAGLNGFKRRSHASMASATTDTAADHERGHDDSDFEGISRKATEETLDDSGRGEGFKVLCAFKGSFCNDFNCQCRDQSKCVHHAQAAEQRESDQEGQDMEDAGSSSGVLLFGNEDDNDHDVVDNVGRMTVKSESQSLRSTRVRDQDGFSFFKDGAKVRRSLHESAPPFFDDVFGTQSRLGHLGMNMTMGMNSHSNCNNALSMMQGNPAGFGWGAQRSYSMYEPHQMQNFSHVHQNGINGHGQLFDSHMQNNHLSLNQPLCWDPLPNIPSFNNLQSADGNGNSTFLLGNTGSVVSVGLGLADQSVDSKKRRSRIPSSVYRGVSRCGKDNKYQARIRVQGKVKYLGRFKSEIEAARCYDKYAIQYLGVNAQTNFPYGAKDNVKKTVGF